MGHAGPYHIGLVAGAVIPSAETAYHARGNAVRLVLHGPDEVAVRVEVHVRRPADRARLDHRPLQVLHPRSLVVAEATEGIAALCDGPVHGVGGDADGFGQDAGGEGKVARGQGRDHIHVETTGTLVYSDRRVVTIGVEDLVIVETDSVLLVCRRDRSEDVRAVVERLTAAGETDLL